MVRFCNDFKDFKFIYFSHYFTKMRKDLSAADSWTFRIMTKSDGHSTLSIEISGLCLKT